MWFKLLLLLSIFFVLTTSRHLNSNEYSNDKIAHGDENGLLMKDKNAASNEYQNEQQQQLSNIRIKRRDRWDVESDKASERVDTVWGLTKTVFIIIIVLICLCALCCLIAMGAGIYYVCKKADSPKNGGGGVVYQNAPPPQNGYYQQQQQQQSRAY